MREIELTKNFVAIVDNEDFDKVNKYSWSLSWSNKRKNNRYAQNLKLGRMHRFILNCGPRDIVDHINNNGLDNRKCNLRLVTFSQNSRNQAPREHYKGKKRTSKYKGVSYRAERPKYYQKAVWVARIQISKDKRLHLGHFNTENEAAIAYNEAAKKHFGEHAKINSLGG